jgi:hypothetical protein
MFTYRNAAQGWAEFTVDNPSLDESNEIGIIFI